jgi:hypothetical protein
MARSQMSVSQRQAEAMNGRSRPRAAWLGLILATGVLAGCVERRFVITSDPPGAIVFDERNQPIGATPVDKPFTYYGDYRLRFVCDGCQTLVHEERVKTPWYEYYPLDFIAENLIPWTIRDIRRVHVSLPPAQVVPPEAVLQGAQDLRAQGKSIVAPAASPTVSNANPAPAPDARFMPPAGP